MNNSDVARVRQILATVKPLAAEYYRLTGKPLGVTGEVCRVSSVGGSLVRTSWRQYQDMESKDFRRSGGEGGGSGVSAPDAPYGLYRGWPVNPNSYFVDRTHIRFAQWVSGQAAALATPQDRTPFANFSAPRPRPHCF